MIPAVDWPDALAFATHVINRSVERGNVPLPTVPMRETGTLIFSSLENSRKPNMRHLVLISFNCANFSDPLLYRLSVHRAAIIGY